MHFYDVKVTLSFALEEHVTCLSAALYVQEKKNFRSSFSKVFERQNLFAIIAIKHDFLIYLHLLGPSGGAETLAFQARVQTTSSGPGKCYCMGDLYIQDSKYLNSCFPFFFRFRIFQVHIEHYDLQTFILRKI